MKKHDTIMVVLAELIDGKPRAARARSEDEALVVTAAQTMDYTVGLAKHANARAIAKKLPEVKVFKTGRALVPRVKPETFDQLEALLTFPKEAGPTVPPAVHAAGPHDQPENLAGSIPNPDYPACGGVLAGARNQAWITQTIITLNGDPDGQYPFPTRVLRLRGHRASWVSH